MNSKIDVIIRQVGNIGEKLSHLQNGDSLPSIELDIILGDIRMLYEEVQTLKSPAKASRWTSSQKPDNVRKVEAETEHEQKPVPEPEAAKEPKNIPEAETTKSKNKTVEKGPGKEKESGKAILADKYKGEKKFINETLAGKAAKTDISSKIKFTPIEDIGTSLGINDRFKLINNLFNGDRESFQNTVDKLNDSGNFNEAFNYINTTFEWDMEDESVQILLDLVRRKFIVNKDE